MVSPPPSEAATESSASVRTLARRHRVLLGATALAALGISTLWLFRTPIITHFVDRELSARGVQASYRIDQLGLGQQRLSNVVIGDPANPDLVARTVDLRIGIGPTGPTLTAVAARGVRIKGRWQDGRLSFGALDRLLLETHGSAFSIPALTVDLADTRGTIDTPWGRVGIGVAGKGALRGGFSGQVALRSAALVAEGCTANAVSADLIVGTDNATGLVRGPVGIAMLDCPTQRARLNDVRLGVDAAVPELLNDWRAVIGLRSGAGALAGVSGAGLRGEVALQAASGNRVNARYSASLDQPRQASVNMRRFSINGTGARQRDGSIASEMRWQVAGGRLDDSLLASLAPIDRLNTATPIDPLARQLARASRDAVRNFGADGSLSVTMDSANATNIILSDARLQSVSGAQLMIAGPRALAWNKASGLSLASQLRFGGGGLPTGEARLDRSNSRAALTGNLTLAPYAAGGAVAALAPIRFVAAANGATRFTTGAALSGPLGDDGRVDRLTLPLTGQISSNGTLALGTSCQRIGWQRLALAGTIVAPGSIGLCPPSGRALVNIGPAGLSGGGRLERFAVTGRRGGSALRLASAGGSFSLATPAFAFNEMAVSVGTGERATRLTAGRVSGAAAGGWHGTLVDAAGKIGPVPFDLAQGSGQWRMARGALLLDGTVGVTDTLAEDRFEPMRVNDLSLRYAESVIRATGTMRTASNAIGVASLDIAHNLGAGAGRADFTLVPINFAPEGTQPRDLSRLTIGTIANVRGTVTGRGRIDWTGEGVRSTGDFTTAGIDAAAAFGPFRGLAGTIHFDDLIGLTTPPGQRFSIASVNPGIEVTDGVVDYQMLSGNLVRVDGGRWPLAGGQLLLQPTLLRFGRGDGPLSFITSPPSRRLTFDVSGVDMALFVQRFHFENIAVTGTVDGVLPTIFDADGGRGRIENGILVTRDGGGSLAYVGELSNRDLGLFGNLAFGALKSIRYDSMLLRLNGRLDGDMVTQIDFDGLAQGVGAENNFLSRTIRQLPFTFKITINAPFQQLLGSVRGYFDPALLVRQNLPALARAQADAEERAAAAAAARANGGSPQPAPVPATPPNPAARPAPPVQPTESENEP